MDWDVLLRMLRIVGISKTRELILCFVDTVHKNFGYKVHLLLMLVSGLRTCL